MPASPQRSFARVLVLTAFMCGACNLVTGASELVSGEPDRGGLADATFDASLAETGTDAPVLPPEEEDAEPPGEEIPDAAADGTMPPIAQSQDGGYLRVFLTSATTTGNMGGVTQGDALCNASATMGGLGGTWRGWLATNNVSASSRVLGNGPWVLLDGTTVAADRNQLLSGTLAASIERNEKNVRMTGHIHVWTGARTNGNPFPDHCGNWNSNTGQGEVGSNTATLDWTDHLNNNCTVRNRLYCFEQ